MSWILLEVYFEVERTEYLNCTFINVEKKSNLYAPQLHCYVVWNNETLTIYHKMNLA